MFSRAPRFAPEKVNDTPGPGAYNPSDNFAAADNYKRGGLFENADRFPKQRAANDPAYDPDSENREPAPAPLQTRNRAATVVGGPSAQLSKQLEQVKLQKVRLAKDSQIERDKLQDRLTHAETMLQHSQKENSNLQSLIASMTREARMAAQREAALRSSLEKTESRDKNVNDKLTRHAQLEKKLEDLQRVHDDGKKQHERKLADQHDAHLQVKKQLDTQLQELKKQCSAHHTEMRVLRSKLADRERVDTLASKERQKHDDQISKLKDACAASDGALAQTRKQVMQLETDVAKARDDARRANATCAEQSSTISHLRGLLQICAQQFSRLVQSSVPKEAHDSLSTTCAALRLRIVRLERKYADRDAQMQELAHLVRAMESHQRQLLACLECAESSLQRVTDLSNERAKETLELLTAREDDEPKIEDDSWALDEEREKTRILRVDLRSARLYVKLGEERLVQTRALCVELADQLEQMAGARAMLDAQLGLLQEQCAAAQVERDGALEKIPELDRRARHAEVEETHWKAKIHELQAQAKKEEEWWADAIKAEKAAAKKLASAIHQGKMREEALQAEVDGLRDALAATAPYEQLFTDAVHTLKEAAARNALAEAETERLSRFNAEIISHANPQNRIFYLDRIRRQLAEAQQASPKLPARRRRKVILSARDRDELEEENEALRHELGLYKSVPVEMKMRTTMTRVVRAPATARSSGAALLDDDETNDEDDVDSREHPGVGVADEDGGKTRSVFAGDETVRAVDRRGHADMTLDELM
ncbi:hypothetical protein EXIGLDRAFT_761881 [Exidia glandulosa HHB12029]|uniref:Hyaluronan-mediated motility receptor C-terminal domain-containing protein n=1 Tax=Exidia glandulosa HHB12029 TaxID=1314781 RepID=A0A165N634_EXIGL|nr:hypothetical protein EXIGLDRAFT_761881 [Exidia glandulosa HHB12029]